MSKGYRKIQVDGVLYQYKVGRTFLKVSGMKLVGFSELTGLSYDEIERARWKGVFSITPVQVAEHIKSVI